MMNSFAPAVPFEDIGPTGKYWLGAFDSESPIHRFLPVGPLDAIPSDPAFDSGPDRGELAGMIASFNLPLSPAQTRALERLADPSSAVVVTGQQPGLGGGPLYTFNKILSAVVYAKLLEAHWDRPVIPILWDGGEDHDFSEINRLDWLTHDGNAKRFEFESIDGRDRPAFSISFGEPELDAVLEFIRSVHPATDRRAALETFLRDLVVDGGAWTDLFDRLWLKVFENHPLLIFRPWGKAARAAAAPLIEKEIEDPEAVHQALAQTSDELEAAGFKPQIHKKDGVCSFFLWDGTARRTVIHEEGTFQAMGSDRAFDRQSLLAELRSNPEAFSPNALLRPVVQDFLLPTAVSVLGPSEIAYQSQLRSIYEHHGVRRPHVTPRLSLTLMSHKQKQLLDEFGLSLPDLQRDDRDLLKRIVHSDALDRGLKILAGLGSKVGAAQTELTELNTDRKAEIRKPIEKQFAAIEKILFQVEDLLRRDEMKRQSRLSERLGVLKGSLMPGGGLQERVFGILPFLARYGMGWVDSLVESAVDWDGKRHYAHLLGGDDE